MTLLLLFQSEEAVIPPVEPPVISFNTVFGGKRRLIQQPVIEYRRFDFFLPISYTKNTFHQLLLSVYNVQEYFIKTGILSKSPKNISIGMTNIIESPVKLSITNNMIFEFELNPDSRLEQVKNLSKLRKLLNNMDNDD